MIKNLTAIGFRCFREIRVEPLTRVNLFVGENNAGKTSLLEAVELLAVGGIEGLTRSSVRRDEQILGRAESGEEFKEHFIDPSHLFFGHDLQPGAFFEVKGDGFGRIACTVEKIAGGRQALRFYSERENTKRRLILSPQGGVLRPQPPSRRLPEASRPRVNFFVAESSDLSNLFQLWDPLVLTPEEEEVNNALRIIEPRVDRMAFRTSAPVVKLKDVKQVLPLGSLGGGMRHLLALVLNLLSARGGVLLVDEIDTGLHYSVMVDMWRLLIESAKRLDIQVFVTTHSLDCVRALARLRKKYPETAAEVTVHRVEKDAAKTVVYDADEIVVAADSHIEVR